MRIRLTSSAIAIAGILSIAALITYRFMPRQQQPEYNARLTPSELESRDHLRAHVQMLAGTIGGRNALKYTELQRAARYVEIELQSYSYHVERQVFSVEGQLFENVEAERAGVDDPREIVVIGAHYDTAGGLPGANDNGSGVAAGLEIARRFAQLALKRSIRYVFFANEEPPYFQSEGMGSYVYAKRCRERGENVAAMLSLETIGYYSDEPGTQRYPIGFHPGYPDRGNFLGFVANLRSAGLLRSAMRSFRRASSLPIQGAAAPAGIPGVGWSDHWSFWQFGYRALMLTDTAPYRYPYYHTPEDTPEKLDYDRLARAVTGIAGVVNDLGSQ